VSRASFMSTDKERVSWRIRIKAFVIWLIARIVLFTVRLKVDNLENLEKARKHEKPIVYAFWHGRQLGLFKANPEKRLTILASLSRDGEMQARICKKFGLEVVRGSSSRGGLSGLMALGRKLRSGSAIAMAVDGPKGPAFIAKPGVVALARLDGSPIVPITIGFSSKIRLRRAWDKFIIPLPFTKATVSYGEPLVISDRVSSGEIDKITEQLTASLLKLTHEVDAPGRAV